MSKIALISDIHFGRLSRTKEFSVPGEAKEILQAENEKSLRDGLTNILGEQQVEYLFVAGDLTSYGSPQEFRHCELEILRIASNSGIERDNIVISLGNHDTDWKITDLYTKHINEDLTTQKHIKDSYMRIASFSSLYSMIDLKGKYTIKGNESFSGVVEKDDFIVFVLNSGFECTREESYGKLSRSQLNWLEENIKKYEEDSRWKIVLLHHHPFDYSFPTPYRDTSKLCEGPEFLDIVGKSDINLVIHGHRHHPKAKTIIESGWKSYVTFICSGSLSVNASHRSNGEIPNTFHIVELYENSKELDLYTYRYSGSEGWFNNKYDINAPLDSIMKLGKIYSDEQIAEAILGLPKNKVIKYEDLNEKLKFSLANEINSKLKSIYKNKVIGDIPQSIYIKEDE